VIEHGTQLQTQPAVRSQQGIPGHVGVHLAVTQDEMRENRKHRFTRRDCIRQMGIPRTRRRT
jgi:hypothetical protein